MPRRTTFAVLLAAVLSATALPTAYAAAATQPTDTKAIVAVEGARTVHLEITVQAAEVPSGDIEVSDNGTSMGTYPLFDGGQSITFSKVHPGKHTYRVAYLGDGTYQESESSSTVVVTTTSAISETLPATVEHGKRAKGVVKVTADGARATGMIQVVAGSKVLKQAYLKKGKATIRLPKLSAGKHKLKILYGGSEVVLGSTKSLRITQQ